MVESYIIDQAEQRTRKVRRQSERPRMEMPTPRQEEPELPAREPADEEPPPRRGVVIIDY